MGKFLIALLIVECAFAEVKFTHQKDRVEVTIDGKPLGSLYFGKAANKPFFHPLIAPNGVKVTRSFPVDKSEGEPTDHPHQKGLWIGAEHLNGMDFWENDSTYKRPRMGRIEFRDVTRLEGGAEKGTLQFQADWIGPEGQQVVREERTMTFYSRHGDAHIFDVDVRLTARTDLTFENHHDAVVGVRLGPAFDEKNGGIAENAEHLRGELAVRGKPSRYLKWRTQMQGTEVGVVLLDHPANLNAPARWHMRSMGIFAANPFWNQEGGKGAAQAGTVLKTVLKKDAALRLRYRMVVYSGQCDAEQVWKDFTTGQMASAGGAR